MEIFAAIVITVILALAVIGLKGYCDWRHTRRRYLRIQANRPPLSDVDFCRKANLELSVVGLVSLVRSKLASLGRYQAARIYPDDDFFSFGLDYDDDVAMFVQNLKIIEGYKDYSFPLEEVRTVADFVKTVLKLKNENAQA
jgi:hypothetical protein